MIKKQYKSIFFLFLLIFFLNTLSADIGIKGGLCFSNFNFSDDSNNILDWKNLMSFQGGIFFGFNISKSILIQPELYYVMKGAKGNLTGTRDEEIYKLECKYKLHYIEVPILFRINLNLNRNFRPGIFVGPYTAYNLSAKAWAKSTLESQVQKEEEESEEDIKKNIKNFDYGIVFGVCFEFDIDTITIILDIRYSLGLENLYKDHTNSTQKNRTITIMVGIDF